MNRKWRLPEICLPLLILLLTITKAHAQLSLADFEKKLQAQNSVITSVSYLDTGDLAVSLKNQPGGNVVIISLKDCLEKRRFNFDNPVAFVLPGDDSGSVWVGEGNFIHRMSVDKGEKTFSKNFISEPLIGAYSTDNGYLLIWSSAKLMLLKTGGGGLSAVWQTEPRFAISSALVDMKARAVYASGYDGTLARYSMDGDASNLFDLGIPIKSLAGDSSRGLLFMGMENGVIRFDSASYAFAKISDIPAESVVLNSNSRQLYTIGGGMLGIYSYPVSRMIKSKGMSGNGLSILNNGNAVVYDDNILNFYDYGREVYSGSIFLYRQGQGIISPDKFYFGGESFTSEIASGGVKGISSVLLNNRPDSTKACSWIKRAVFGQETVEKGSVLTGNSVVNSPTTKSASLPSSTLNIGGKTENTLAITGDIQSGGVGKVSAPKPKIEKGTAEINDIPKPWIPDVDSIKPVLVDKNTLPKVPQLPQMPSVDPVLPSSGNSGINIPSWVINPASLPSYSAVRSGVDSAGAMIEAKKKLREDIARAVMKNMLDVELVKQMSSEELKKRFLWMVGGRTGQLAADYVMQKDYWISPDKKIYVLAQITADSVEQIYNSVFQEQIDWLNTYGGSEYLKQEPVKWE